MFFCRYKKGDEFHLGTVDTLEKAVEEATIYKEICIAEAEHSPEKEVPAVYVWEVDVKEITLIL